MTSRREDKSRWISRKRRLRRTDKRDREDLRRECSRRRDRPEEAES
jgi:hypothetical protein